MLFRSASLGPQTWLVVFDAENRKSHAAFSGSARGMTPDGASLSLDSASVRCARVPEGRFSLAPPPAPELPDYLVCMLDEARFAHGEISDTKRRLFEVLTPLAPRLPIEVSASDSAVSFSVNYVSFDPFRGLDVRLTDKASGESATYQGPARSMLASFLFGLTIGDRATEARFLRLGCVWTDDPSKFK